MNQSDDQSEVIAFVIYFLMGYIISQSILMVSII